MRVQWTAVLCLGLLMFAATANADVAKSQWTKDGDYHEFTDDLLNSDVSYPRGGSIVVRPPPMRSLLIRPRSNFIPEMLKSVENM